MQNKSNNKPDDNSLKRFGKFSFKLFFCLILIRLLLFLSNAQTVFWNNILNLFTVLMLVFGLMFSLSYQSILLSIREFLIKLPLEKEEEYARKLLNYFFYIMLLGFLILLLVNEFKSISSFCLDVFFIFLISLAILSAFYPSLFRLST
jgi:Ca2+/Na+ antiporter